MPSFSLTPLPPFPPPSGPFPSGTQFQDETVNVGPPTPRYVSFNGPGVQATYDSENGRVNVEVATGGINVLSQNTLVMAGARALNFVGDGVVAMEQVGPPNTVAVIVPGAAGGGGGPVPLFRATRQYQQNSGPVITYDDSTVFNSPGDFFPLGGYYQTTIEGYYYFTASVPFGVAVSYPRTFGYAIAEWPAHLENPASIQTDVVIHAQHVVLVYPSGGESAVTLFGTTMHTGPVRIAAGRRIGVVGFKDGDVLDVGFYGSVHPFTPSEGKPYTPAVFSGEYLQL